MPWFINDIPQWVGIFHETQHPIEIGHLIWILDVDEEVFGFGGTVTDVRAVERDWITLYITHSTSLVFELSCPFVWTSPPLEYIRQHERQYHQLPRVLNDRYGAPCMSPTVDQAEVPGAANAWFRVVSS